jgi:cytoskeletal protein RodZ
VVSYNGIGEIFKNTRIERGLSIADIENGTKIRSKYIEAIEEENFEVLPGEVYVKGFIKSYAKFLNIENDEEIKKYLESNPIQKMGTVKNTIPKQTIKISRGFNKKYITVILGILAIGLLFGVQAFYQKYIQKQSNINNQTPIDHNIPVDPIQEELPRKEIKETKLEKVELTLEIIDVGSDKEACWVQFFSDEQLIFEGTLYQGDKKIIEAKEKIKVILGNAGVVKLSLGEKELGIPGKVGQVVEKEFTLKDLQ